MSPNQPLLILATRNSHKVQELRALLAGQGLAIEVRSLAEFASLPEVDEDGRTFAENAAKKALYTGVRTGLVSLADDSGLEVEHLRGLPGVRSSRYAGEEATDEANNVKLLAALRGVPHEQRGARFRSVVAVFVPGDAAGLAGWELDEFWCQTLAKGHLRQLDRDITESRGARRWDTPWGAIMLVSGRCGGFIAQEPRGSNGFGYDPLFYYPLMQRTFGEMSTDAKNEHSHRARAFAKAMDVLRDVFA